MQRSYKRPATAKNLAARAGDGATAPHRPQEGEPRPITGPLVVALGALATRWSHKADCRGDVGRIRTAVCVALWALTRLLLVWNTDEGKELRRLAMALGNFAELKRHPAPLAEVAIPEVDTSRVEPGIPGLIAKAGELITAALHANPLLRGRRREHLSQAADMLDRAADLDMAASAFRAEIDEARDRMRAVAFDVYAGPGSRGTLVPFPMTPGERALDLASIDYYEISKAPSERRSVADLLARVVADGSPNPTIGVIEQGAAEARAWLLALADGKATFAAGALLPVFRAMAARLDLAAQMVRRERERPTIAIVLETRPEMKGPIMWGAEEWGQGGRMMMVEWTPNAQVMAERLNDALEARHAR